MTESPTFHGRLLARWLDTDYRRHARREGQLIRPTMLPMMWVMVAVGSVAWLALLTFGRGSLQVQSLPGMTALAVFLGCVVADSIDSACNKHTIADFSWVIYTVAAAHFGLHWEIVLAGAASRGLTGLRLFPVGVVSLINANLVTVEAMVAGVVASVLHGHLPGWALVCIVAAARLFINNFIMVLAPFTGPIIPAIMECIQDEWRQLLLILPILAACMTAAEVSPVVAVIGAISVSLMSMISSKSTSDVVIAESKLDIDEKTSLHNFARFLRDLGEQVVRGDSTDTPFGVFMIDIDHFKQLNDRHGHLEGDVALLGVANALRDALEGTGGSAARFGGEEFSVIVAESSEAKVEEIADRVRIACKEALKRWDTSVSIGVAHHAPLTESSEELLARADSALYEAKRGGRDRVCVADPATPNVVHIPSRSLPKAA